MTRTIDAPELWGIGRYVVDGTAVPFPVSQEDLQRDMGSAMKAAGTLGVTAGERVLVISTLAGAAQWWPMQVGALASGAKLSCADASRFDAFRTVMFLRQAPYAHVVGVTADVLDGVEQDLDLDLAEAFANAGTVVATPPAAARLADAGVATRHVVEVGPALAVGCADGALHVDGDEWELTDDGGRVLVSARRPRAATVERVPTGLAGTVADGACGCGRPDGALHLTA